MFIKKLRSAWKNNNSLLCVGLDPDLKKIPQIVLKLPYPIFEFNKSIVDSTADLVCAYKPQIAYYSAQGAEDQLQMTINYIQEKHPHLPVILDAKRNDIGSTAEMYAAEAFDRIGADAVTVNPYMGSDSMMPFLNRKNKGVIVLCRTSNPGAIEIQNLKCNGKKLYEIINNSAKADIEKQSISRYKKSDAVASDTQVNK